MAVADSITSEVILILCVWFLQEACLHGLSLEYIYIYIFIFIFIYIYICIYGITPPYLKMKVPMTVAHAALAQRGDGRARSFRGPALLCLPSLLGVEAPRRGTSPGASDPEVLGGTGRLLREVFDLILARREALRLDIWRPLAGGESGGDKEEPEGKDKESKPRTRKRRRSHTSRDQSSEVEDKRRGKGQQERRRASEAEAGEEGRLLEVLQVLFDLVVVPWLRRKQKLKKFVKDTRRSQVKEREKYLPRKDKPSPPLQVNPHLHCALLHLCRRALLQEKGSPHRKREEAERSQGGVPVKRGVKGLPDSGL